MEARKDGVCGVVLSVAYICFMRPLNLFVELQELFCHQWHAVRPDKPVFQARERAAHRFRDFLKRRITHSSPQRRCIQRRCHLIVEAQSVRFTFGRPAVPLDGRALSFSRAAVTPIKLSASAPHRHIVTFDKRIVNFTRSQILNRDSSELSRGFVCCVC